MPGVLTTGFERKTLETITDDVEGKLRSGISPVLDLSSSSLFGELTAVFCSDIDELWQLGEAIHAARDPDRATGAAMRACAALTGTIWRSASKTLVKSVTVNVDAGFDQPAGAMVAHVAGDPTRRFVSKARVQNTGGAPANVSVDFEAETTGPVECPQSQLTVIAQPLSGWNSVTNPNAGETGLADESEQELRVRREAELQGGSTAVDAIRADILKNIKAVRWVTILENDSDVTDGNGVPAKSFEAIVRGPDAPTSDDNAAVAAQILASKPAGIKAYGSTVVAVKDSMGNTHNIGLTRPTVRAIYVEIDADATDAPADAADLIKAAVAGVDGEYDPGDDVVPWKLGAVLDQFPWLDEVLAIRLGFSASPVGTTKLSIALREVADLDVSRIVVNLS